MKTVMLFWISIILQCVAIGQVGINTDNSVPDNSAMLDVNSSAKSIQPEQSRR